MTFAEELSSLKGPLKRAAIDAYMKTDYWLVNETSYIKIEHERNREGAPPSVTVERPAADGEGGGKCTERNGFAKTDGGNEYITRFDEIRDHIDSIVNPWLSLKEPDGIDLLKDSLDDVFTYITPNNAQDGGGTGVQSELSEIERHLGDMTGSTIAAYKSNFLGVLYEVVNNIYILAANNAAALGASKGAVEGAQKSLLGAVKAGTDAFNSVTGGSGDFTLTIEIVSAANSVLGSFLPPQAKAVSGAAGAALGLISALAPDDPGEKSGAPGDYSAAMNEFESMIRSINETLDAAEDDIAKQARECYLTTCKQNEKFDLSVPKLSVDDGSVPITQLDEDAMNDIISVYMPEITSDLQSAGNAASASKMTDEVERDASIGYGAKGPADHVASLAFRLDDLLKDLSWETEFAEEQLRLALADFQQQDQASADALRKHEERINENPYDTRDEYI